MESKNTTALLEHFSNLTDPRIDRTKLHKLSDIVVVSICAMIGGSDGFDAIEMFGNAHYNWFKKFLELPNGIPSHDTFARVWARLDPNELRSKFTEWASSLSSIFCQEEAINRVIAIDGQTLRGAKKEGEKKSSIHIVSAWSSALQLVLAQKKVDEKSNEITAIPDVLRALELKGCIVTLDAMGCQTKIAEIITKEKNGDYIFGLKGNQGSTLEAVEEHFKLSPNEILSTYTETDKGHGRIEERSYFIADSKSVYDLKEWPGLQSVVKVVSMREIKGERSEEERYYLTSLAPDLAESIGKSIREHWGVENNLHYVLDVTFRQDSSRIRKDNAPENLNVLRHIALNLLKGAPNAKKSSPSNNLKRQRAAMDTFYLEGIVQKAGILKKI